MDDHLAQYSASIERMNAIAAQGKLTSIPIVHAYRVELKTAMRSLRRMIAAEANPDTKEIYGRLLTTLKRLHWSLIVAERCSVEIAIREN